MPAAPLRQDEFFARLPAATAAALRRAGVCTTMDLLLRFPLRHEDWRDATPVARLQDGMPALVEGEMVNTRDAPARRGRHLLTDLRDAEGNAVTLRFFNVTPGLRAVAAEGRRARVRGVARRARGGWEMAHPKMQSANAEATVEAIYPAIKGVAPAALRRLVARALREANLQPVAPPANFEGGGWTLQDALAFAHAPAAEAGGALLQNAEDHPAWRRLRFEELLAHQIVLRWRYHRRNNKAQPLRPPAGWSDAFFAALPFELTGAQLRACGQIAKDMSGARQMRRLLQGDVGSGKTVVAAHACLLAAKCDKTAAFLAPTEILAEQHHRALSRLFAASRAPCELITGAVRGKKREAALQRLRFGISRLLIGTHAIFQESVELPQLALAVVDEQHRFGVRQRQALANKGKNPHLLMMSATPIPRTLAMSRFADVDVSVLDEKPAGRRPVRATIANAARRDEVLARIAAHAAKGGRAYWVCPLIEEAAAAEEEGEGESAPNKEKNAEELANDAQTIAEAANAAHPQLGARVLHGRMKAAEKSAVMEDFRAGKFSLLVATTVVEVGVDVPQADVMVIERADRMGLSQLHQLRGRVGRGGRPGFCVLMFMPPLSQEAAARLRIVRDSEDGFEIARLDLQMRGPGEWLGNKQSGLPALRVARLNEDDDIVAAARQTAEDMLKNARRNAARHVRRWLGGKI